MRIKLKSLNGTRALFRGVFVAYGTRDAYRGGSKKRTILLRNVTNEQGDVVADHVWMNESKLFADLHLRKGETVEFFAHVRPYTKAFDFRGNPCKRDYKLTRPRHVRRYATEWI